MCTNFEVALENWRKRQNASNKSLVSTKRTESVVLATKFYHISELTTPVLLHRN